MVDIAEQSTEFSKWLAVLCYDAETGQLVWRERDASWFSAVGQMNAWNARFANRVAGCVGAGNYRYITMGRHGAPESFLAHRLCWLLTHGNWPSLQIDHVNGQRDDNRLVNLREVSSADNCKNMARGKRNTSGVMGVSWSSDRKCWVASIKIANRAKFLGRFDLIEDAMAARKTAEYAFGFHPNHGVRSV